MRCKTREGYCFHGAGSCTRKLGSGQIPARARSFRWSASFVAVNLNSSLSEPNSKFYA